jgi:glutamate/aspartate transport system substrate-binding protein
MKTMTRLAAVAVTALAAALIAANAQAQELTGTLKKIKDAGVIVLGHRESSVPYSYIAQGNEVVGYSHEFALKIVEQVKKAVGNPNLTVRLLPINAQNRITLMQNGTIDLECGGTSNTAERRKQVEFSNSLAITQARLLTRKDSSVKDWADLSNKTVVVTAGTTSERFLREYLDKTKATLTMVSAKDHAQAFILLQSGRAAAFFMDSDVLAATIARAKDPADYTIVGAPQTHEAIACMLRREDPAFKTLVDRTIAGIQSSGEAAKMWQKWFDSPIAPNGINLKLPLPAEIGELFAKPNDKTL